MNKFLNNKCPYFSGMISATGLMMCVKDQLEARLEYLQYKKKIIEEKIKQTKKELKGYQW